MIEDLDTLLAELQGSAPKDKASTPSVDGQDPGGSIFSAASNSNRLTYSKPAQSQFSSELPRPASPPGQSSTNTNLAALDNLLDSLNAFPDADLQLDGDISPLTSDAEPAGMAVGERPDVGQLLGEMEQVVSNPNDQNHSVGAASSATRDLDLLMRNLSDLSVQMSSAQSPSAPLANNHHDRQTHGTSAETAIYSRPRPVKVAADRTKADTTAVTDGSRGGPSPQPSSSDRLNQLDKMLGHLQSDMSRQGIQTTAKGTCSGCQKTIVGQVITALGRTWHPEHFTCVHCGAELARQNFFEKDGKAYCEKDYHAIFAPRCAHCDGPILDRCMTALGKTWHPEHFFCAHCGRQFGPTEGFHEKDGQPYCRDDYFELFAPKCGACSRPILESFVSALGKQWHPECFNCMECGQPFQGGNFYEYDLKPYCEKHYYNRNGGLCHQCKKSISGRCITAMGRKFHPEHFVCAFCMKQLHMGTFKEQNDRSYCMPCFTKLFG